MLADRLAEVARDRIAQRLLAGGSDAEAADPGCVVQVSGIDRAYDGPDLDAGDYTVRYQVTDGFGQVSEWASRCSTAAPTT